MVEFWEMLADIANTIIFFIAGVIVYEGTRDYVDAKQFGLLIVLYIFLHLIRSFMLFLFWPLTRNMGYGLTSAEGIACAYGGLRGAVGLALALIIDEDHRFEEETRELAVFLMSGIAFLTLLSMPLQPALCLRL